MKGIFISHRTTDKDIVSIFVDFLKIIGVPADSIFCSSLPGNDVKHKIDNEIKEKLVNSQLNIVFLSSEFFKSIYCLNEEGILWYKSNDIPLIVIKLPEINQTNLIGFIDANYKLRDLSSKNDISSIYDIIKPIFSLNNSIARLNTEIETLTKRYQETVSKRGDSSPVSEASFDYNRITDDEAAVLFYIWKNKKRKLDSPEILMHWLQECELFDIDISNGFDLLVASQKANYDENNAFIMDIEFFRSLTSKRLEDIPFLEERLNRHLKYSKQTYIRLWKNNCVTDEIKLFSLYIINEKTTTFGTRWLSDQQIESIEQWQIKNFLDKTLSENYLKCLQFFIDNDLVFPSSFTSYGNPKAYTLFNSLKDLLLKESTTFKSEMLSEMQKVKQKHSIDLPF